MWEVRLRRVCAFFGMLSLERGVQDLWQWAVHTRAAQDCPVSMQCTARYMHATRMTRTERRDLLPPEYLTRTRREVWARCRR